MRIALFILLILSSCNNHESKNITVEKDTLQTSASPNQGNETKKETVKPVPKNYSNDRFRDVTAEKITQTKFRIKGEGRIFEANFNWIVEDGHEELKKGFQMTDAGAPEWGKFDFTIDVQKKRENSTLTLILFESSAKDGSRQFELPILLN